VTVADGTGRPQFYELLRVPRSASYVAFDILWLDGTDLRALPLDERRRRLQGILPKGSPIVSEALFVEGRGRELFELMCANDLEGIVAKRLADPYDSRIRWLKIKNPDYSQAEGRGTGSTTGLSRDRGQCRNEMIGSADDPRQCRAGARSAAWIGGPLYSNPVDSALNSVVADDADVGLGDDLCLQSIGLRYTARQRPAPQGLNPISGQKIV
jgi:hypothetical protein